MPDLAQLHPQIVHFVVALLIVGVLLRLVSLTGKVPFANGAAATLILLGTVASVVAVSSGTKAHGPAERVPGARAAVMEHEEWGERTRNAFLIIAAVELMGLAIRDPRRRRMVHLAAGVLGLAGLGVLYEAAEHGGTLVYAYAGGVGIRSGDPADVEHLLVAGLYHEAMLDRADGRGEDAARLIEELARRRPDDPDVQMLAVESLLLDRTDPEDALAALRGLPVPEGNRRIRLRHDWLLADAYDALGFADSARLVLEGLKAEFPTNRRVLERLGEGR